MRWTPTFSFLAVLIASSFLCPQQTRAQQQAQHEQPQMVWVNYVDGAVKFSPGHKGKPQLGKTWIVAKRGQVLEDGYTLVTEEGRTGIEFEDGSAIYLAPHSVLEFNQLLEKAGATETELSLLTGTATIQHASENSIYLNAPSAEVLRIKTRQTLTIESTLDGLVLEAVVPLSIFRPLEGAVALQAGDSVAYTDGRTIPARATDRTPEQKQWSDWVTAQLSKRQVLIERGMKEAGLQQPIPGLAGMAESGVFYDCPPYGKCWRPASTTAQSELQPRTFGILNTPTAANANVTDQQILVNRAMLTRCPMQAWQVAATRQGRVPVLFSGIQYGPCLAGSWAAPPTASASSQPFYFNNACWDTSPYAYSPDCTVYPLWVAGGWVPEQCRIVKLQHHRIGILPRHPLGRPAQPAPNQKSPILVLDLEHGRLQARVENAPAKPVAVASSAAATFERNSDKTGLTSALRAPQPVIEARLTASLLPHTVSIAAGHTDASKAPNAMQFDYKSGNFVGHANTGSSARPMVMAHVGQGGSVGSARRGAALSGSARGTSGGASTGGRGSSGGGSGASHGSSGGGSSTGGGGGGGHSGGGSSGGGASSGGGSSAGAGGGHH
jgi:hypothetical protein